jgi:CRISPR-associated endonuclease/helicase Cas3
MMTIEQLFKEAPSIASVLKDHERYWAHLPADWSSQEPELLHEHVGLVNEYAERLSKAHGLDAVLDSLSSAIAAQHTRVADQAGFAAAVKKRAVYCIVFHDFGKVNPNFQIDRMKNGDHFKKRAKAPFFPEHGHSELSAFLYNGFFLRETPPDTSDGQYLAVVTLFLSYSVLNHHNRGLFDFQEAFEKKAAWDESFEEFAAYGAFYGWSRQDSPQLRSLMKNLKTALNRYRKGLSEDGFPMYALVKLVFSLLTASDYLATSDYMNQLGLNDFGIIDEQLRAHIVGAARTSQSYNVNVYKALEDRDFRIQCPRELGNRQLNQLRKEMAVEVLQAISANRADRIFYIEAPTGGGKTNISMLAAAELLKAHQELNKIYYVFPFTTLVTQTFQAMQHTYQLKDTDLVQLHAKAGYNQMQDDSAYGAEKINYLHNLFSHYPITLLTHIRFFDLLKTNYKEANYPFHRLANSIVVIDELQSYNPKHWDKIIYLLDQYARHFNIYFVLMSATLPKLGELLEKVTHQPRPVKHLLPDAKTDYFQNPNFSRRVEFDFSLLKSTIGHEALLEMVLSSSREYAEGNELYPGSVYTIVEFIFKRSASAFYQLVNKQPTSFFDEVLLLSGTVLEPRRREVINLLKNEAYRGKKVLLITTQVVEAGVDIDMDLGFKDSSLIDSDEQLAGRINRNVKKKGCKLFLFQMDRASILYKKDLRYQQVSERRIKQADYERILQEKDFDYLYKLVFQDLAEWGMEPMAKGFSSYTEHLARLEFDRVHKEFQLIEQDNLSVFVPLALPLSVDASSDEKDAIFSGEDLAFLSGFGIEPSGGKIAGAAVFDLYVNMVKNREGDFIRRAVNFKRLQSIMSRFVFSVFANNKMKDQLYRYARNEHTEGRESYDEYGYLYLLHYQDIYRYQDGLVEEAFEDVGQLIL